MKTALSIQEKLKDLRVERGLTLEQLAEETGISKSALGNYETEDYKDISHFSVTTLAKFYGVSADYLLGLTETKEHPNTDLAELHLGDDMLELLKSGKLNNRLLSEMALHKDFGKLLADIEIYVDRIASMQIQNINSWMKAVRQEVIDKYNPSEDDPHLRLLEAAQIEEDEYFRQMVCDDIVGIIRDIREAHKGDTESAPVDTNPAAELKKGLEAAANYKGSKEEQKMIVLFTQMGIDHKKVTPDDFQAVVRVFSKAKVAKNYTKQRGKKRKYLEEFRLRHKLYRLIDPGDNNGRANHLYDFIMMAAIVVSIIPLAFKEDTPLFQWIDNIAVVIFIIDYLLRLCTADLAMPKYGKRAFALYPFTPMAIIDLLSILPSLTALNNGFRLLKILRLLRTFRVFRVFKLFRYSKSISRVVNVLRKQKTALFAVGTLALGYIAISALVMFNVEPDSFNTFFDAVYWATISLTTVGYGDIYPVTTIGQTVTMISSFIGIAIVALPAGIITAGYMVEIEEEKA